MNQDFRIKSALGNMPIWGNYILDKSSQRAESRSSETIRNLICGYSRRNRERKHILVLNAFVDDSSAQVGKREFCLAGYMTTAEQWMKFSDNWEAVLQESPAINGFHAVEAQSLKGEFLGWSAEARDEKVFQLARVIEAHPLLSFDCRMSHEAFERILLPVSPYDLRNPYSILFQSVMLTATRQLLLLGIDLPIDFVFDEQGKVGMDALLWYGTFRAGLQPELRNLLGSRPIFKTDKELIPLQAADCLAWHLRRSREEQFMHENRPALPLLLKVRHVGMEVSEDNLHLWADQFAKLVPKEDRLRKGASVVQSMKKVEEHIKQLPREKQNEEYERFNEAMEQILKIPPEVVKAAMEVDKKEREKKRKAKRASVSRASNVKG